MRRAFTLVEALIAISLGMVVVGVAFSGFRAATHTVRIGNRIALENALLRAGVCAAHEELDLWREYDDPQAATHPNRAVSGGVGLPFAPFKAAWPAGNAGGANEDSESYRGDQKAWDPSDSRTWYRGNLAEHSTSKMWFGRYCEFSTEHLAAPDLTSFSAPVNSAQSVDWQGSPPALHHWYPFQIAGLRTALGFYGLCDYAPSNAIFSTYDPGAADTLGRNGAVTDWYDTTGGVNGKFRIYEYSHARVPPGKYRCTAKNAYAVIDPHAVVDPQLSTDNRYGFCIGSRDPDFNEANEVGRFLKETDVHVPMLPNGQPSTWPNASVSVSHFIKNARHINICKVRLVSPVTGDSVALTFSSFGTTLRGARQQRGRDGGWASWDDKPGAANTPTLDDP